MSKRVYSYTGSYGETVVYPANERHFNLHADCTLRDVEGPPMPKCVRCSEEVNEVNDVGICEDCAEEESEGE